MRVKRFTIIIIWFCVALILLGAATRIIQNKISASTPSENVVESIASSIVYITGYDGDAKLNYIIKTLLAIIGLVCLALFGAHLTVNLFCRIRDVKIIAPDFKPGNESAHCLCLGLINQGRSICNAEAKIYFYDKESRTCDGFVVERSIPFIKRAGRWDIRIPIYSGTRLCEYLRMLLYGGMIKKMIVTYTYVDVITGQQSIRLIEYDTTLLNIKVLAVRTVKLRETLRKALVRFLAPPKLMTSENLQFKQWLKGNTYPLNIKDLKPVNEGVINITKQVFNIVKAILDFRSKDDTGETYEYAALAFSYNHVPFDLSLQYRGSAIWKLTLHGANISKMSLEFFGEKENKLCSYEIVMPSRVETVDVPINMLFAGPEKCESITKVYLTVRQEHLVDKGKPAMIFIKGIRVEY